MQTPMKPRTRKKPDEKRMRDKVIGVPFPPDRVADLQAAAEERGCSLGGFLRLLAHDYLRVWKKAA